MLNSIIKRLPVIIIAYYKQHLVSVALFVKVLGSFLLIGFESDLQSHSSCSPISHVFSGGGLSTSISVFFGGDGPTFSVDGRLNRPSILFR